MNRFAEAFLIPREHLIKAVGQKRQDMTWIEIMRLKRTYGVPATTMLARLGQVGILSQPALNRMSEAFAQRWRDEEPEPIAPGEGFAAFEKPQHFEGLVWHALGEDMISPFRVAQMLGLPLSEVEEGIRAVRCH